MKLNIKWNHYIGDKVLDTTRQLKEINPFFRVCIPMLNGQILTLS